MGGPQGAGPTGQDRAQQGAGRAGWGGDGGDLAPVELGHPAGDGQAEAGAARGVVPGAEALEDPLGAVGGDAGPLVADLEDPPLLVEPAGRQVDLSPSRAVPHGVVDEVGDELGQPGAVGVDDEVGRLDGVAHPHGAPVDRGLGHGVPQEGGDLDVTDAQGRCTGVDAGEVEQVGDEGTEPLGLLERPAQGRVVRAHDAVDEVLEEGALCGERRPQLVRDGGDELAALLVGIGEVGGHGVERPAELADLVGGGRPHPLAVVARGHRAGGLGHLAQRRGHPPRQPLGHRERTDDGHGDAEPQRDPATVGDLGDRHRDEHADPDEDAELDLDRRDAVEGTVGVHGPTSRA